MIVRCRSTTIGLSWGKGNEMRGGEQQAGVPHQDFGIARQGLSQLRVKRSAVDSSLHWCLAIQHQCQSCAFRVMHGIEGLEKAQSLLKVETSATEIRRVFDGVIRIDYIGAPPV